MQIPPAFLLLLWGVPLAAATIAARRWQAHRWLISGVFFGLVVSPASLGLYSLFYIGKVVAILGLVGLPLVLVHGAPGFHLAHQMDWLNSTGVVRGARDYALIESINGVVWAVAYGALGAVVDYLTQVRRKPGIREVN